MNLIDRIVVLEAELSGERLKTDYWKNEAVRLGDLIDAQGGSLKASLELPCAQSEGAAQ